MRLPTSLIAVLLAAGVALGQYSGTYTIMPSGGDFASHAEAAESLMTYGVVGPCTLLMYTGTYYGQASFDSAGWDSVEVMFKAAPGESPGVEYSRYPWYVNYTDNITVDGVATTSTGSYGYYIYYSNHTQVRNQNIIASNHGAYNHGSKATLFENCKIGVPATGIYCCYSDSTRVIGCRIRAGIRGLHMYYSGYRYIVSNNITADGDEGIYAYNNAAGTYSYYDTIVNNMVYCANFYGMFHYHHYYGYVAYNTFYGESTACYDSYCYNTTYYNNIFQASILGLYKSGGSFDSCDYNCYWARFPVYHSDFGAVSLEQWRYYTDRDSHSIFRDPKLGGPSNLHLRAGSPCIDSGLAIPEFPLDIDGDTIHNGVRDIGADEYTGVGPPLAGTYLIHQDQDSGDYSFFTEACTDLALQGIAAACTFDVAAGTYNEQVAIVNIHGGYPVVFQARGYGSSAKEDVTIEYSSYPVKLTGADSVSIQGFNITAISSTYGVYMMPYGPSDGCDWCVIRDNCISAYYGLWMFNHTNRCSILGNQFRGPGYHRIYCYNSSVFYRNTGNVFANNMASGWTGRGIYMYNHDSTKLIFNTFYGSGSYGFYDSCGYNGTYHGNIFVGDTYCWYKRYGSDPVYCDYNCYWPDRYPIYHSGYGPVSLDQWRAFTQLDSHSVYRDPLCVSYRDGHLRSRSPCRDSAVNWPGLALDVDGDTRASPTDIGADDFQLTGSPLSGTYLIHQDHQDPDSGDYGSFYEATCDLMTWGCSGPVVFDVAAGTYHEAVEVHEVAGGYPVTYQARGDEEVVIDATGLSHGIELTGVDKVRFRNLTVLAEDYGIRLRHSRDDGCAGCLVEGCSLVSRNGADMGARTNHCSLVGNYMISDSGDGVLMSGLMDEPNLGNVFINNMLIGTDCGISCNYHDSTAMVYNSVWSRGLYALYDHYGHNVHMQNNIFYGPSRAWHKLFGGVLPVVSDFNCFWTDDPGRRVIYHSSLGLVPLAQWQEFSQLDSNSISLDPLFVSETDLHLQDTSPCVDVGLAMTEVPYDIDGELRDSTPCIGADEVVGTGIEQSGKPLTVDLFRPAPNPASGPVRIRWQVPTLSRASLKVYNIMGQCVSTLVGRVVEPGVYVTVWHSHDRYGRRLAPGIYFYTLETGGTKLTRKVVIQR